MAEICLESNDVSEPRKRSARRRRMDIRRFKFVAGAESMASTSNEIKRKERSKDQVKESTADNKSSDNGESLYNSVSSSNDQEVDKSSITVVSEMVNRWPRYGMTSVCGRRKDMEDAVSIRPGFLKRGSHDFYGVFDGHGCSHVAATCRDRMHEVVEEEVGSLGSDGVRWKEVMERSFSRVDGEALVVNSGDEGGTESPSCRCELQMPKCDHVGSTAVVAVVSTDRIVVANCGDSRAVLSRKGVAVPLSSDHKPDRSDELERIQAAGGRVIYWDGARVLGVLAMSRAIGDSYLKPFVISEPEVTITERTDDDECLILASDGLWDVVRNETACDVVRSCLKSNLPTNNDDVEKMSQGNSSQTVDKACSDAAVLLTKLALARQSADNVSVVVVDLRRKL